jgi:hypothetical protein
MNNIFKSSPPTSFQLVIFTLINLTELVNGKNFKPCFVNGHWEQSHSCAPQGATGFSFFGLGQRNIFLLYFTEYVAFAIFINQGF